MLDGRRAKMILLKHLRHNFHYLGTHFLTLENRSIVDCAPDALYQYCVQAFEGQELCWPAIAVRFFRVDGQTGQTKEMSICLKMISLKLSSNLIHTNLVLRARQHTLPVPT